MQDKLKCYEEALAIDPGSRLFFPLAKLYLDNEQIEKAEKVLKTGGKISRTFRGKVASG